MKRLTGKVLLAAAGLLLGGQVWADGEYNLLEQLRQNQVKKIKNGNYQLFIPRAESSNNDNFGNRNSSFGNSGFLTDNNRSENNEPTERCLRVSGSIVKPAAASMGYLAFSLQFSRTFDFRGKALRCKFMNLSENRPEAMIVRFFKKDAKQPLWTIQYMDPPFSEGSELVFDPHASGGNLKAVIGQGQANDINRIEFWFGNSENTRHNFRIMEIDIVQGSAAEAGDGGEEMGGQMAANGSLMTRAIRDRLSSEQGQVGFFENGEQSFIRVRGVPGSVDGLEGSWLRFRLEFPRPLRLADKRLVFRCESLGGVDKLVIRGWGENAEKPAWSVASTDKAFSPDSEEASMEPGGERPVEFRLSEDDPKNLTVSEGVRLDKAVRSLEFLVSASALPEGRELRAEIIGLELNNAD